MKRIKYIALCLMAFAMTGCEKYENTYNAQPIDGLALYQVMLYAPMKAGVTEEYIYEVRLDDKVVANETTVMQQYNTLPQGDGGVYFTAAPGTHNLKLYQGTTKVLCYNQDIELKEGRQGLIVHDLTKEPIPLPIDFSPYPTDSKTFDSDTITHINFINLMYETDGTPTDLKLQYQYQYTLHPIYTYADRDAGKIPEGKKVGDATDDTSKSAWLNLGSPVGFGEQTNFQPVPCIPNAFVSQGLARVDYRIVVPEGGVVGVTINDDVTKQLLAPRSATNATIQPYTDYWTAYHGRYHYHFYAGFRTKLPGVWVYTFWGLV